MSGNSEQNNYVVEQTEEEHQYTVMTYGDQNYRILTREFKAHDSSIKFWSVFWTGVSWTSISILISDLTNLEEKASFVILGVSLAMMVILTLFTFIQMKRLSKMLPTSCLLLTTYLVVTLVLTSTQVKGHIFAGIAYSTFFNDIVFFEILAS